MKKVLFFILLLGSSILMAQTLVDRPQAPIGEQFYHNYNSISLNVKSTNGIEWIVTNCMRNQPIKITFNAQGGGSSAHEDVVLNGYNSYKSGSLGRNLIGGSLVEYSISGNATCDYIPTDHNGCIGYIAVSYYGEEVLP